MIERQNIFITGGAGFICGHPESVGPPIWLLTHTKKALVA